VVGVHAFQGTAYTVAGQVARAQGNHHPSISPYGLFQCADGKVQIACGSEGLWVKFATGFGIDPLTPGMATNADRVRNLPLVIETVNGVFAEYAGEDLLARLAEIGIPAGRVRTMDEVYEWDQVASQHLLLGVEHPVLGRITLPGSPIRLDDNPFGGGRAEHLPPPRLGEHNESVRAWLDSLGGSDG
jgi:crotonobetainyl-CoA:carnitine CoA-transferase CaiB-like acyl-CoA transferase